MSTLKKVNKIAILGCGWFGFAFAKKLISMGYEVNGSTTTPEKLDLIAEEKIQPFLVNFTSDQVIADHEFFNADVLFICIPPKRNSIEVYDYAQKIASILNAAKDKVANVVLISATSVYGDENKAVNELTETNPDTESGKVIVEAENILKIENPDGFTIIRFGGLIGPDRNPGRFFAGKTAIPNGLAPVNLIHQTDAVNIAINIIEKHAFGRIYNACSPMHPTRKDFYTAAAEKAGLVLPGFVSEKKAWKVIESVNVPRYLEYNFQEEIR
ncbi:SDR family NAD(P)-dependent oxidoreductase [Pedobacter petrophilus]|uniref:SDR family NAD(P)-dependent oxidoreductase n=1 Tax=Pedobacter petrophilus TaxID=1908241 RepID=A0A7K0FVQ1_9SPHI|nr:SDR family oxidoreductase [Pedobacter petrophilus]MRX75501.1 SDR family NAD(P)-dependent oxidoreductase [Pedobacter petrophilus]